MLTYSFQILDVNEFDSLQVIISVVYKALTVLGKVQHVQPAGDDVDVVHPGVGGVVKVPSSCPGQCWAGEVCCRLEYFRPDDLSLGSVSVSQLTSSEPPVSQPDRLMDNYEKYTGTAVHGTALI